MFVGWAVVLRETSWSHVWPHFDVSFAYFTLLFMKLCGTITARPPLQVPPSVLARFYCPTYRKQAGMISQLISDQLFWWCVKTFDSYSFTNVKVCCFMFLKRVQLVRLGVSYCDRKMCWMWWNLNITSCRYESKFIVIGVRFPHHTGLQRPVS